MLGLADRPLALRYPIGHNPKAGIVPLDPAAPIFRDAAIEGLLAFNLSSAANFKERHYKIVGYQRRSSHTVENGRMVQASGRLLRAGAFSEDRNITIQ